MTETQTRPEAPPNGTAPPLGVLAPELKRQVIEEAVARARLGLLQAQAQQALVEANVAESERQLEAILRWAEGELA